MATLHELQQRLAGVRSRERSYVAIQGLCRVLVTLIAAVVVFFLLDWVVDLPYGARLVAAGAGLAFVCWVAYRCLYVELRRVHDDDEVALRIEARNPDLRGRLISSMQLARTKSSGAYAGSDQMLAALEEETLRMAAPLDFSKIVSTVMLKRLLISALIIVGIKIALVAEFPDHFKALAERLINPDKEYPTRTRIKGEVDVPRFVARGEDIPVRVSVDAEYKVPARGTLRFINAKNMSIAVELLPIDATTFGGKLARALEDVDLVVEIGDARSKRIPVKVLSRPEVDSARSLESVRYTLPVYTEEAPSEPQKFGALSALQGSLAEITFTATKPLKSAVLERSDGTKYEMKPVAAPVAGTAGKPAEGEGLYWSAGGFPIDKCGTYHVSLTDLNGLTNSLPALEYPIDAKPDLAPTIKLLKPAHDATVTPSARPVIVYNAHDDYGLRVVWLVYKVTDENDQGAPRSDGNPESQNVVPAKRIEYQVPRDHAGKQRRDVTDGKIVWDLAELKVKSGDQIVFWLECDDYCESNDEPRKNADTDKATGKKVFPRTNDIKFTVISRQDKEAELRAERNRLYQLVERSAMTQEELKERVLEIQEMLEKLK